MIKRLPAGSANGASGWTFSTIRFLYHDKNQELDADINLLTNFCKAFLSGRLCQDQLLLSRAVLIPKDRTKYRPLGIGECWYRFGCRVIMRVVAHSVGLKLAPLQLGCGVASGCAIGASQAMCALKAAPESVVLIKTDFSNAFNSIPRRAIYDGLAKYCPGLLKWFRWAYGDSRPLHHPHTQRTRRGRTVTITITQPRARTIGENSPPSALPRQDERGSRNTAARAAPRPRKGGKKGKQQRTEVVLSASYAAEVRGNLTTTSRTLSGEELGFESDEDRRSSLTAFSTQGLYNHHHAWRELMREVVSSLCMSCCAHKQ